MITIKYEIKDNKWLKNGKKTTQKQIKEELTKDQLKKLKQDKKLTRRIKTEEEIKAKENKNKQKQAERDNKLINSVKKDYRIENGIRKGKRVIEVWRKNQVYGYYNFAFYLDKLENLDKYILEDIRNLENIKKNKKQQVVDDEI